MRPAQRSVGRSAEEEEGEEIEAETEEIVE
jgi:hypothetical protein